MMIAPRVTPSTAPLKRFGVDRGRRGDNSCLQSVGDQRDKHRGWVEKHIPQERADPAHRESAQRVQQDCGGTDHNIVQVETSARHRHPKRTEGDIHCHKDSGYGQPGQGACPRSKDCRTLPLWQGLDKVISDYLTQFTLADLIRESILGGETS